MNDATYERGMKIRRQVLGDRHVDLAEERKTDFDDGFQRFITETAWGTVWAGEALDLKTRHLVTIGLLVASGNSHELAIHLAATRNTGVSPAELREVLLQAAVYAGVPAANRAFALAKEVLSEPARPGFEP